MGRSSNLFDFVRNGAEDAWVEVEVKDGQRTIAARRKFTKGDNRSEWLINGARIVGEAAPPSLRAALTATPSLRAALTVTSSYGRRSPRWRASVPPCDAFPGKPSTESKVLEMTRKHNVQVDNLWFVWQSGRASRGPPPRSAMADLPTEVVGALGPTRPTRHVSQFLPQDRVVAFASVCPSSAAPHGPASLARLTLCVHRYALAGITAPAR